MLDGSASQLYLVIADIPDRPTQRTIESMCGKQQVIGKGREEERREGGGVEKLDDK